ncbi:MAG: MotA/TolQ/ExbB proton channel family protein [Gammaproteobacteria bacterium]|nr:MotA/TolQ/ExbB proton channel family protein [Gammaproteobacteria bacterium]
MSFLELVQAGGAINWILFAMSLVAMTVALAKGWQLYRARPRPAPQNMNALTENLAGADPGEASSIATTPRGRILQRYSELRRSTGLQPAQIHDELMRLATAELTLLSAHLRTLEIIAATAPLLGLLGTVLGMIDAFQAMELTGDRANPQVLSGGIWKALLTTACGLAVAIPVGVAHHYLERAVDSQGDLLADDIAALTTAQFVAAANHR